MISIVITAFKEPKTIGKAIESVINQDIPEDYELIVSAPDEETLSIAKTYASKNKKIKVLVDPGKGKSVALNLLYSKLRGEILFFTDGDVYMSNNSIKEILEKFNDKKIGCVTGRPIPLEDRSTQYGFWANFLFDAANLLRSERAKKQQFLECSGYLFAYRKGIIKSIPLHVGDDAFIPHIFWDKGYKIGYSDKALVYVKNVDNWNDWVKQKTRTTKSHETLKKYVKLDESTRMKSFVNEAKGINYFLSYPKSLKEYYWLTKLVLARLYMWWRVFYDTRIINKPYTDNWARSESSKGL